MPASPRTAAHGTHAAYSRGCRCEQCVAFRRAYDRTRYRKEHPLPSRPDDPELAALWDEGFRVGRSLIEEDGTQGRSLTRLAALLSDTAHRVLPSRAEAAQQQSAPAGTDSQARPADAEPYDVLYPHTASQSALCKRIHPAMEHKEWQAMADRASGVLPPHAKPGNGPGGANEQRKSESVEDIIADTAARIGPNFDGHFPARPADAALTSASAEADGLRAALERLTDAVDKWEHSEGHGLSEHAAMLDATGEARAALAQQPTPAGEE